MGGLLVSTNYFLLSSNIYIALCLANFACQKLSSLDLRIIGHIERQLLYLDNFSEALKCFSPGWVKNVSCNMSWLHLQATQADGLCLSLPVM